MGLVIRTSGNVNRDADYASKKNDFDWMNCRCAIAISASSPMRFAKLVGSGSCQYVFMVKRCAQNRAVAAPIRAIAASDNVRGASLVSSSMILDCCALLIPSSNANREMVQIASTIIPTTASKKATGWTAAEYLGRSNIIPTPTAMLASTLNDNSQKWGQNGSKSPEINLLTYVGIAAIAGWLIAGGLAVGELLKSLLSLWRERRHGAS
jgi:hypothetical protein